MREVVGAALLVSWLVLLAGLAWHVWAEASLEDRRRAALRRSAEDEAARRRPLDRWE